MLTNFFLDLRWAIRSYRRQPLLLITAALCLGLGLGATTGLFHYADQLLFRDLPVRDSGELAALYRAGPGWGRVAGNFVMSVPMYRGLRDAQSFNGVFARGADQASLSHQGRSERVNVELVTGNSFPVAGIAPRLGRLFTPDDDRTPGGHPLLILSHAYWQRRFGADPSMIGQTVLVNKQLYTIIGVTPEALRYFQYDSVPDVFVTLAQRSQINPNRKDLDDPRSLWVTAFGRLRPGVSRTQAAAELKTIMSPILENEWANFPIPMPARLKERFLSQYIKVEPAPGGLPSTQESARRSLFFILGFVVLVLLVACANTANLLLARAVARQREIATRLALGAGRLALVRQLIAEGLVLAAAGGAMGWLLATGMLELLRRMGPPDQSFGVSASLDPRTFAFHAALTLATVLLFSLVPAWQAARVSLTVAMKSSGGNEARLGGSLVSSRVLVVFQVSVSLVLLAGAALFIQSLRHLRNTNPGFKTSQMLTLSTSPVWSGYSGPRAQQLAVDMQSRLAAIPGVTAVSFAESSLLAGDSWQATIDIPGYKPKEGENTNSLFMNVGPSFFATLGIPLQQGREFDVRDRAGSPRVAVVNQAFARQYFGNEPALGRRICIGSCNDKDSPPLEIIGVVPDLRQENLIDPAKRAVYLAILQPESFGQTTYYLRTAGDPASVARDVRQEVSRIDSTLALFDFYSMDTQVNRLLWAESAIAALCTMFGIVAALLSAVGLYGVLAYAVARRTRELGIRLAIGAERRRILSSVLVGALRLVFFGLLIGIPASLALARFVDKLVHGVSPRDPYTIAAASAFLALVATAAAFAPAWRASRIDPMKALRYE